MTIDLFSSSSALALRELRHWVRVPGQILFNVILTPLIWLGLFGLSFEDAQRIPGIGVSYIAFITPTIATMAVLLTTAPGSMCIVLDRRLGFFRRLLALPVSRVGVALGYVLELVTKSLVQVAAVLLIAAILGVQLATGVGGAAVVLLLALLLSVGFACLGLTMALRVDDPGAFAGMATAVVMPLVFLAPGFFPASQMPAWLETLTRFNPVTYFVDPVRLLISQGYEWGTVWQSIGVLLGFDALASLIMVRAFTRATAG